MGLLWGLIQKHIDNAPYPPSERQVARKLGVSPNTLAHWRDLKRLPSRDNLQAVADLVGVRYSVVLDAALYDTGYHENAAVIPLGRRPVTAVEAELQAAEQDLAELPLVPGSERKRAELQARVDTLRAGRDSSRPATGSADSVAES